MRVLKRLGLKKQVKRFLFIYFQKKGY